jgi:hypothetical protein
MELEFNDELEYFNTVYYCQTMTNNDEMCLVCHLDEREEGKQWDRYQLKCRHICHTRCLRRWCGSRKKLNCPFCGDIPEVKNNMFCSDCQSFGHSNIYSMCPIIKKELMRDMNRERRQQPHETKNIGEAPTASSGLI